MSSYWQAKIWGLLHDSALKSLQTRKSGEGPWQSLRVMNGWKPNKLSDWIASASDRAAIGSLDTYVNYDRELGLEVRHLLSGERLTLQFNANPVIERLLSAHNPDHEINQWLNDRIPQEIKESEDAPKVFWYLWRCFPQVIAEALDDYRVFLLPAETRIPDCSLFSHNSTTAAIGGSLEGIDGRGSHPHLLSFTFSPIQEMIKASRKMQDFWAGSWIIHYLSACICWQWAEKFGADCLVYPSLFDQPLIDHWLLQKYDDDCFHRAIKRPTTDRLLSAGFPNVLVAILPESSIEDAVNMAKSVLRHKPGAHLDKYKSWLGVAEVVKKAVYGNTEIDSIVWENWLVSQWQFYWAAMPIGYPDRPLRMIDDKLKDEWKDKQNRYVNAKLFTEGEEVLFALKEAYVNVGSWWSFTYDRLRLLLKLIKSARSWELPTAFGERSTISGIGPVVRSKNPQNSPWVTTAEVKQFWRKTRGLFNQIEMLNATEVVKRGLERGLPQILNLQESEILSYPDLTVGVAGAIKTGCLTTLRYRVTTEAVLDELTKQDLIEDEQEFKKSWGIAYIDREHRSLYHPRLLNFGWLKDQIKQINPNLTEQNLADRLVPVRQVIDRHFPSNNPTDWYVLCAGDGDNMSKWLKGELMQEYKSYIPQKLHSAINNPEKDKSMEALAKFVDERKRMGPATHVVLSRALLDFSNQLLPYLTNDRYAGRLIYSGGDDLFAYTNLWEWDNWLKDVQSCFRGEKDERGEFVSQGNYWQWKEQNPPPAISPRPLFTMGKASTISFGVVIANQSVPLAIALEELWQAEEAAKNHRSNQQEKDAVQVKVIYSSGNILSATCKMEVFAYWSDLLDTLPQLTDKLPSLFEQAGELWHQYPCVDDKAIVPWIRAFIDRRDIFHANKADKVQLIDALYLFIHSIWTNTSTADRNREVKNWLRLAAFCLRKRQINGVVR